MQKIGNHFIYAMLLAAVWFLIVGCNTNTDGKQSSVNIAQEDTKMVSQGTEVIWHIKALHPEGRILDVKALDKEGNIYDVKAIQYTDQTSLLDIKAFVNGQKLPVKVLVSEDKYMPVKAITDDGVIMDIKALTPDGKRLDVKGVSQSGNIIHIKAVNENGEFYAIEAISPNGWINDVKGVKMFKEPVEVVVNGVEVYAHIKALTQSYY